MCIELICSECKSAYRIGGPGYRPPKPEEQGIGFICRDCAWKRPDYTITAEFDVALAELNARDPGDMQPAYIEIPEQLETPSIAKLAIRIVLVVALVIALVAFGLTVFA